MFRSLYSKLALALLCLFMVIGISFIIFSVVATEKYQQEVNQKLNRKVAELIVAEKIILHDNRINQEALKEIFHMLMVINPSIEVYLLDPGGNIMAFSAEPGKVMRKTVNLEPVKKWITGNPELPIYGDDPRDIKGRKIFTAAPIAPKGSLEGYLYVILGGETYDTVIDKIKGSYILRLSIRVVSISLLLALVAGLLIFAFLTRRLKLLAADMDRYGKDMSGEEAFLSFADKKPADDEIGRLSSTFNSMTERINDQVEKVRKSDILRRELVANVSHDLRTPLATLRGYIETLLMKDNTLTPEERRKYLSIAIDHCERLSKLIEDLFELAKLEAQDSPVYSEAFNISELVQDVIQKFDLVAKEKNINIVAPSGKELPFAFADIALIERVIENLLDNAVQYTPEKGSITIELSLNGSDTITVRISDTGPGIAEKEQHRIFDRFYQSDKSRKDKVGHSGLGLAITKRILELHGSSIDVRSAVNAGTTFSFDLPIQVSG